MSGNTIAKPVKDCRNGLMMRFDVDGDGTKDVVQVLQALDSDRLKKGLSFQYPGGVQVFVNDVKLKVICKPDDKPGFCSSATATANLKKIEDLKSITYGNMELKVGNMCKGRTISGFAGKVVFAGKNANGKRLEYSYPVGVSSHKPVKFLDKLSGGYEISIRIYAKLQGGGEEAIILNTDNPICTGPSTAHESNP